MKKIPGKLIVFEGLDGCGSTTQAELLKLWYEEKAGTFAYCTKEPSDGPLGSLIRLFLTRRIGRATHEGTFKPLDEVTLALAFAADRMDHLQNEILPKLENGITVIGDRYYLSSLAYQAVKVDYDWIKFLNSKCRKPDLTIFLDVPPVVCKKRMEKQRWHVELYEEASHLEVVRKNYLRAIQDLQGEGENICIVDGNRSIQEVHREVVQIVKRFLPKTRPRMKGQLHLEDFLRVDENTVSLSG